MYIVMIASECAPVSKVGGLADVVDGLSCELLRKGHNVEIILPYYDCMNVSLVDNIQSNSVEVSVPFKGKQIACSVHTGIVRGNTCYFVKSHSDEKYFERGNFYGAADDDERFALFSVAAVEFLGKAGKQPDVIHCHDWQTALIPVLLRYKYKNSFLSKTKLCYTIHNIKHQGKVSHKLLDMAGLSLSAFPELDAMADASAPGYMNLMKGGIVYSDYVTTVSPKYATETRTSNLGEGLESVLSAHASKYEGILNGIEYDIWSPEKDHNIPVNYSVDNIEDKYKNKDELRKKLSLRNVFKPILAVVGRLDAQKGVHLIRHSLLYSLNKGMQFVLLGSSPDKEIDEYFHHLKHYLRRNSDCSLSLSYDEELSHLIYAGSDMILIPSLYEPCGLTQLIAMRYGTVPIVRNTGGLSDTVFDIELSQKPQTQRNGFAFEEFSYEAIESVLTRAQFVWNEKPYTFREIMTNAMKSDYSWTLSADRYLGIYSKMLGR
ncbi:glycogen synthase [Candidatus Magnetomonas plexicatena]|uniref:glycogen synthase n=1 Tax=Candidatus Magnetomonas plexicatena TaxID=2552947 RepID=UPI001C7884A6|nr:glycogen synthase [Nitrospirales bacterium LBB_01]